MPNGTLHYRLRIRTASDEADLLYVTSVPDTLNPYIKDAPSGDGSTLDPLTGKVSVGAYTVRVIDAPGVAYNPASAVVTDGWEYADQAAAESAGWVFTDEMTNGSITVGATDQTHGGSKSLKMTTDGDEAGYDFGQRVLRATRTYTTSDGITADTLYLVTVYARMDVRPWYDTQSRLTANGVTATFTEDAGSFAAISVTVRSSSAGSLAVTLQRQHSFVAADRNVWWDDLTIQALTPTAALEGRVVTSALADLDGRQQLLSKRAYVEESEDGGDTWAVICAGYVNRAAMTDALLWEFTIGESRRVEQTKRVFDRISDPLEHPDLIGVMDRASCIMGGPIVGDWGGCYVDRGRPLFEVEELIGSDIVRLKWLDGGGSLHSVFKENGPPMVERVAEFMTDAAREYLDKDGATGFIGSVDYAPAPGLVTRLYNADTSAWVSDQVTLLVRSSSVFSGIGDYILCGQHGHIHVRWSGTLPVVGDQYRLAMFPRSTSDRNPMHWSGHPMDLVADCLDYCGLDYDDTSRLAMRATLGDDLVIHIRVTQGETCQKFLEDTVYGPFGVAPRLADDGEIEFVQSRSPDTVSSGTLTVDDIAGELTGTPWVNEESSAANRVVVETQTYIPDDRPISSDDTRPFDAIRAAKVTVDVKAEDQDEQAIYGDKEVRFTLPGCIQVGGAILSTGTQESPGALDLWVSSLARPLFDWQGRGAIRADLDIRRGVTDARIGDVVTLDLAYFPTANPAQSPVSQRGTDARRAVILRRTVKPDRVSLYLEDRGLAATLADLPTFTLAADATFPKTTVEVTVTNEATLVYPVRVEMAQGASEPSSGGQFVRLWRPNRDANPFDLPPVCAGNVVWVRMRSELNGQVGAWTDWQSLDLDDLTAPSDLAAEVINTSVTLTWTNGETTLPVEVLARLTADTTMQSVAVLPASSTSYTLTLTDASTGYTVGVRYLDPRGCTSATTTTTATTDVAVCIAAPTNLAAFADGAGTFGVELDAAVIPGGVEIWVAVETALGSATAGTYSLADTVPGLQPPLRTRWAISTPSANDGLLRFIKTQSSLAGYTSCGFSSVVTVNPWTVLEPADPTEQPDPTTDPALTTVFPPIPLLRPGHSGLVLYEVGEDRVPLPGTGGWRGTEEYPSLAGATSVALSAVVVASTLPDGAYLACEFELPGTAGTWVPMEEPDGTGPTIPLDPTSLDLLDENADEDAWVVKGAVVALYADAVGDVRVRAVIGGGDETGAVILGAVTLWPSVVTTAEIPQETTEPPLDDPGSCDTPGAFDDFTGYADETAAFAAWGED